MLVAKSRSYIRKLSIALHGHSNRQSSFPKFAFPLCQIHFWYFLFDWFVPKTTGGGIYKKKKSNKMMTFCWFFLPSSAIKSWHLKFFFFFLDFIYLFMRDTEREAETQAEGEAGSMQGTPCGTRSQDSRITPWVKAAVSCWATQGSWVCPFDNF